MNSMQWRDLLLFLQSRGRRIHPGVWIAAGLLAFALIMQWLVFVEIEPQVGAARIELSKVQRQLLDTPFTASTNPMTSQHELENFQHILGDPDGIDQVTESLFQLARELDLDFSQAQYSISCEDAARACRYRLQFPLHGKYVQIRTFMLEALRSLKSLSVDNAHLQRANIGSDDVDAELTMNFYTRATSAIRGRSGGHE